MTNYMKYIMLFIAFVLIGSTPIWVPVYTDGLMSGTGTSDDPLSIDTSKVATAYDLMSAAGGSAPVKTISPSQLTGDQDNYSPTGVGNATYLRISGDNGIRAITGITDSVAGVLEKTLLNIGSYPVYLPMDHPDSDAAHRFTGYPGDYIIYPGMNVKIWYDLTSTKWRVIGSTEYVKPTIYFSWSASTTASGLHPDVTTTQQNGATMTATVATATIPTNFNFSTSTASNSRGVFNYPRSGDYSAFGAAHMFVEAVFSIPTLSDGTQAFDIIFGLTDIVNSIHTSNNAVGIRYSHDINGGEWEGFSRDNAAAESLSDSGIAVAAATTYKLRVEIDKSKTEARYYINGSFVGRVTGSMPASNACTTEIQIDKDAGTTARNLYLYSYQIGAIYP